MEKILKDIGDVIYELHRDGTYIERQVRFIVITEKSHKNIKYVDSNLNIICTNHELINLTRHNENLYYLRKNDCIEMSEILKSKKKVDNDE